MVSRVYTLLYSKNDGCRTPGEINYSRKRYDPGSAWPTFDYDRKNFSFTS